MSETHQSESGPRPRLLDLFSGAGGAAVGYHRAGFDVVGVDIAPQPRYPFKFVQGHALGPGALFGWPLPFDAVHASPPCQAWSRATAWSGDRAAHPKLIEPTRGLLRVTGLPYVIENVQEARHELHDPIMLCGSQFGIRVQSHRYFEIEPPVFELMPPCHHRASDASRDHGAKQPESVFRDALDCPWMTVHEAREAIPPAYTEWIGAHLMAEVRRRQKAAA